MARIVQEVVDAHYEPGRQDRSKEWVYRTIITNIYPMSRSTFYRYLRRAQDSEPSASPPRQHSLFD